MQTTNFKKPNSLWVLPAPSRSRSHCQRLCRENGQYVGGPTHLLASLVPKATVDYDCCHSNGKTGGFVCVGSERKESKRRNLRKKLKHAKSRGKNAIFLLTSFTPSPLHSISYFFLSGRGSLDRFLWASRLSSTFCSLCLSSTSFFSASAFLCFSNWNSKYFRFPLALW